MAAITYRTRGIIMLQVGIDDHYCVCAEDVTNDTETCITGLLATRTKRYHIYSVCQYEYYV